MTTRPDWFVIVNPASGSGRSLRGWHALEAALAAEGLACEVVVTRHAGDGEAQATAAVGRGLRRLLAVGGDGTLHEVLNGALSAPGVDSRELVLAVAPFGTGNDWARGRGVPREPLALARCLAAGRTTACDLGCIEFTGTQARPHRHFINVAGAGIDAEVLAALPSGPARRTAYLLGLLRALWRFRPPEFVLVADSREERGPRLLALAANGAYCGNGMRLAPQAATDDGLLDIVTVEPMPLFTALLRLPRLFDGRLGGERWVRGSRAACLEIQATPAATIEADGQLVGTTPARVHVLAGAIRVLDCAPPA